MTPVSSSGSGQAQSNAHTRLWVFAPLYLCWFSNGGEPFQISGGNEISCKPEAAFTITQARERVKSIFGRFPKMARSLLPQHVRWRQKGYLHDMCQETWHVSEERKGKRMPLSRAEVHGIPFWGRSLKSSPQI